MAVAIATGLLQQILAHAAEDLSREACGLLLGDADRIREVRRAANVAADPRRFFELEPATHFAALRVERAGGLRLIGHYHSHPFGGATPSVADARAAEAGRLWLIVGAGAAALFRAVAGGPLHGMFEPVGLHIDAGG